MEKIFEITERLRALEELEKKTQGTIKNIPNWIAPVSEKEAQTKKMLRRLEKVNKEKIALLSDLNTETSLVASKLILNNKS